MTDLPERERNDVLYTYKDAAEVLRVSVATIMSWVRQGMMPSPRYFGSAARFEASMIDHVAKTGLQLPGTHEPFESPRARIGRLGAAARREKAAAKKRKAKRPPAKKKKNTPKTEGGV